MISYLLKNFDKFVNHRIYNRVDRSLRLIYIVNKYQYEHNKKHFVTVLKFLFLTYPNVNLTQFNCII